MSLVSLLIAALARGESPSNPTNDSADPALSESAPSAPLSAPPAETSPWKLGRLADALPVYLANRLPLFFPTGAVRVYARPHFNDLIHPGYSRVPVGARVKISDQVECNAELTPYFAHGGEASGAGLSELNLGAKYEQQVTSLNDSSVSFGANYRTPFNGSPKEFTDGYRHFQPFIGATHPLVPAWEVMGYGSVGANFLEHTSFASNFGRNQLHANSLSVSAGALRAWGRWRVSLTARLASTALMSDENRQNFSLRPEVIVPLRKNPAARTQIFLTLGARAIWGPDGFESGTSTSLRVQFKLDRERVRKKSELAELAP
jgi:hypothetical protein